jgi:hypothetical protein
VGIVAAGVDGNDEEVEDDGDDDGSVVPMLVLDPGGKMQ